MKTLALALTALISLPVYANTFTCELRPFSQAYQGSGETEIEARVNTRVACAQKENIMFCKLQSAQCMQTPTVTFDKFYCEIEAFSHLYYGFGTSQAFAASNASGSCQQKESAMFCTQDKVQCYKLN